MSMRPLGNRSHKNSLKTICNAAGERVAPPPIFCAYTNSAKEMWVFVRQTYHFEHFLKIPLAMSDKL